MNERRDFDRKKHLTPRYRGVEVAADRHVSVNGPPSEKLPGWGLLRESEEYAYHLHPPISFEIHYCVSRHVLFFPFTGGKTRIKVGSGDLIADRMAPNAVRFMPARTVIACIQTDPIEFLAVAVEPDRLDLLSRRLGLEGVQPTPGIETQDPALSALASEMRRHLISEPVFGAPYMDALTDAFLVRLLMLHTTEKRESASSEMLSPFMMRKLAEYVDENLDGPIKVRALSEMAGLSRSHFSRAFHRSFGQSARDFVLHRRVSQARRLLVETDDSMTEISGRCGFSTPSHFSTSFRREVGLQPAVYRQLLNEDPTKAG